MEDALQHGRAFIDESNLEITDALTAEAAKTDPHAFGDLYDRYYGRVYRYIYHRIGNQTDAEDVTAQVFMKAFEAIPSYRTSSSSFAPWIFRISRNAVVDYYRRQRPQSPLDDAEREGSGDDPALQFLKKERSQDLRRLLTYLSGEQREVVLMRYAADLSFAEISSVLRKREAAVRMLLHRALRKLKTVVEEGRGNEY